MDFLKTAIFVVVLFVHHLKAQDICKVDDIKDTEARLTLCTGSRPSSQSTVTVEAKPVNRVSGGSDGPREVPVCQTTLQHLCPSEKYKVKLTRGNEPKTCDFTTAHDDGDVINIKSQELQDPVVTSNSVKLKWKHARCFRRDTTMYYQIETDIAARPSIDLYKLWGDKSLDETHEQYEKSGLNPGTKYKVTIKTCKESETHCSKGIPVETTFTTLVELNPPQNLTFTSVESDSFEISWEKPAGPAEIEGYRVIVGDKVIDSDKCDSKTKTKCRLDRLEPNTLHRVQVLAFYGKLTSVPLSTAVWTKEKMLNPPQNLKFHPGSNEITLFWESPKGTPNIERYHVTVGSQQGVVPGYESRFSVDGLKPNTQYGVRIFAIYKNLTPIPISTTVWTTQKRYNPPRNLTVQVEDTEYTQIIWSPPEASKDKLVGYQLIVDDASIANVTASVTAYKLSFRSSESQRAYEVKVLARYGEGDQVSDPVQKHLLILKSGAISSLKCMQREVLGFFTLLSIFLTWARS